MKTTKNSIIAIVLACMMVVGFTCNTNATKTITIQTVNPNPSADKLLQAASIISARLHQFSTETVEVAIQAKKNSIQVSIPDSMDIKTVESLITQEGKINFYTIYERTEFFGLIKNNKKLCSILGKSNTTNLEPKIGCWAVTEKLKINDYLKRLGQNKSYKFAWSRETDSTSICLYALKLEKGNVLVLTGADIENVQVKQDKARKINSVDFSFKGKAIKRWADITKQNIGNSIAIVLDNTILCAPRVNSSIDSGNCSISGNFTLTEVRLLAAFGNSEPLPLSFTVVK